MNCNVYFVSGKSLLRVQIDTSTHKIIELVEPQQYLNHVVIGAQETKVSSCYLDGIKATKSKRDVNIEREQIELGIYS